MRLILVSSFPDAVVSKRYFRFLPVMVTRIMISLKKAAASQDDLWSLGQPTSRFTGVMFAGHHDGDTQGNGMTLDTFERP